MLDDDIVSPAIELLGTAVGELMEDALPTALSRSRGPQERQARADGLVGVAEDIRALTGAMAVLARLGGRA